MSYDIEIKGLTRLRGAISKAPQEVKREMAGAIKTSVNIIRPIMSSEAPSKTSKLRRNIQAYSSGLTGRVGPNLQVTPYAWFVHQGTRPYTIRPRNKKALYWEGALHPVKKVSHPGIKANPFVERTVKSVRQPVQTIFQNTIDRIINNITR